MKTSTKRKPTRRGATRFPGIVEDAKTLGVNRSTLYKMLTDYPGYASLRTLRRRYDNLQKNKAKQ